MSPRPLSRRQLPSQDELTRRLDVLLEPPPTQQGLPEGDDAWRAGRHRRDGGDDHDVEVAELAPRPMWSRSTLAVVAAVGLVAVVVSAVLLLTSRAEVDPVATPSRTSLSSSSVSPSGAGGLPVAAGPVRSPTATPSAPVVVDVAGLVQHPGVVTLPPGARAADAVAAAGGVRRGADLSLINLARHLTDGEQVLVAASGAPRPAAGGQGSGSGATTGPLNLNSATTSDLDDLPGIGPVLAQRIVTWREQHGSFAAVDELQEVAGIGERLFSQLQPLVTV